MMNVWGSMETLPGHLSDFSLLSSPCSLYSALDHAEDWILSRNLDQLPMAGDALIGLPCLRKPRSRKRWVRVAAESRLRKRVPLNTVLSDLVVHSTFLAHEVSWKCAAPPPCSVCSHRDKDESQHLAVGCTPCLKHHLGKLG